MALDKKIQQYIDLKKQIDELEEKTNVAYTASIPLKRFGSGEDVANACVFLGSDHSTYISGQVLSVCGAMNT